MPEDDFEPGFFYLHALPSCLLLIYRDYSCLGNLVISARVFCR